MERPQVEQLSTNLSQLAFGLLFVVQDVRGYIGEAVDSNLGFTQAQALNEDGVELLKMCKALVRLIHHHNLQCCQVVLTKRRNGLILLWHSITLSTRCTKRHRGHVK